MSDNLDGLLDGLEIRHSRREDYEEMLAIYERARNFMSKAEIRDNGTPHGPQKAL